MDEGIDDLKVQTVDSTAVSANTAWPTDSALIRGFIERAWRRGKKLSRFDAPPMTSVQIPEIIDELKKLEYKIAMTLGRKGGKGKRKGLYQEFLSHRSLPKK